MPGTVLSVFYRLVFTANKQPFYYNDNKQYYHCHFYVAENSEVHSIKTETDSPGLSECNANILSIFILL